MLTKKFEIFTRVLEMARNGTAKTEVISEIDLNQEVASYSLSLLIDLGLLTETRNSPVSYKTTEKGLRFLKELSNLKQRIDSDTGSHETFLAR